MGEKNKKFKDGGEGTKIGNWLRSIDKGEILQKAIGVVGSVASGNYLGAIQTLIKQDPDISPEQEAEANRLIELDYADRDSARKMQIAALGQDDLFSKRFVYYLTIGVFSFSVIIVLLLFWVEIPEPNRDVVNFILGVVVGTGLTGIFNYFFGSSQGSKDKAEQLKIK